MNLTASFDNIVRMNITTAVSFDSRFRRLRTLVGEKLTPLEKAEQSSTLAQLSQNLSTMAVKRYIHTVAGALMWLVVVYNLLLALV